MSDFRCKKTRNKSWFFSLILQLLTALLLLAGEEAVFAGVPLAQAIPILLAAGSDAIAAVG